MNTDSDRNTGPDDIRRILRSISLNTITIIVFDEFDRMPKGRATTLLADTIKGLSDNSVTATIVIVGVANSVGELLREHASIGRPLVEIPMPRMSDEEIEEVIEKRVGRLGMSVSRPVVASIVKYSQGLPHYAHLMGLYACQEAALRKTKAVSAAHLRTSINNCISKARQSIRDAYYKATSSPRSDHLFREVLLACSLAKTDDLGFFAAADVVEPMNDIMEDKQRGIRYEIPSFANHLKQFCSDERGNILQRRGLTRKFRYRFSDPLMQPFITLQGVASGMLPKSYQ